MTFGWSSEATSSDSRRNLLRKSSSCASSGEITFSATLRPSRSCVARKTVPIPPRPSNDSIVYPPNVSPTPGARRSVTTGPHSVPEPALVLDQVLGVERFQLLAQLPHELGQLLARVHRLVRPHSVHQLIVRAECGSTAAGSVSLDHVANQPVRLRADRDLVALAAPDEHEPRLIRVVAETFGPLFEDGPRRLRVGSRVERELEEASLARVRD